MNFLFFFIWHKFAKKKIITMETSEFHSNNLFKINKGSGAKIKQKRIKHIDF